METSDSEENFDHHFDLPRHAQARRIDVGISKPRCVTRGTLPIRQFHRIDQSKILMEERYGQSINIDITDF